LIDHQPDHIHTASTIAAVYCHPSEVRNLNTTGTYRELRKKSNIETAFRVLDDAELRAAEANDIPDAPNGYAVPLAKLRLANKRASITDALARFAADLAASRMRDMQEMRKSLDDEPPAPRLTAAELDQYRPPDVYGPSLKTLREKRKP